MEQVIIIIALILSVVIHEMAHGYMANWLGDPTARLQGRLSGNPLVHIDPIGSVVVPSLLILTNAGFLFGWAKPVPYNPYNLNDQKYGEAKVAAAGPAVNVLLAIIFAMLIRSADFLGLPLAFIEISSYIVFINLLLAFFNMIPIPPLDGSKVIVAFLPTNAAAKYAEMSRAVERYGIFVLFLFIFIVIQFIWPYLFTLVISIASLLTGLTDVEFFSLIR